MRKWIACSAILVVLALVSLGLIYYLVGAYIPGVIEKNMARLIQTKLNLLEPPSVKIQAGPLGLMRGKITAVVIYFPKLVFNNVASEKVRVRIRSIHLDVGRLVWEKKLELKEPFDARVAFYLPEAEVKNQLHNHMVIPYNWEVELKPGRVLIDADVEPVPGEMVPTTMVGRLRSNGQSIQFEPVKVLGVTSTDAGLIEAKIFSDLKQNILLQNLPTGVKILRIEVLEDRLFLAAEAKDIVLPEEMMNR